MSGKLFVGGVPVGPDVAKLMELNPQPGVSVSYDEIERLTANKRGESRFNTVVQAWRKRVFRDRLLQSKAEGGSIHFMTADETHDYCRRGLIRVGKASGRLRVRTEAVDTAALSPERLTAHALLRREALALVEAAQKSAKAIAAPKAVVADRPVA